MFRSGSVSAVLFVSVDMLDLWLLTSLGLLHGGQILVKGITAAVPLHVLLPAPKAIFLVFHLSLGTGGR